jgi:predicted extracellular nuclease
MNQMNNIWTKEGSPWSKEGILQDQVLSIRKVPKVAQAALNSSKRKTRSTMTCSRRIVGCVYLHDRSQVPTGVVQTGERSSVRWEGQLGDQERGGSTGESESKSDKSSSTNEHSNVLSTGLNGYPAKHD